MATADVERTVRTMMSALTFDLCRSLVAVRRDVVSACVSSDDTTALNHIRLELYMTVLLSLLLLLLLATQTANCAVRDCVLFSSFYGLWRVRFPQYFQYCKDNFCFLLNRPTLTELLYVNQIPELSMGPFS